jgi:hypothetical protein
MNAGSILSGLLVATIAGASKWSYRKALVVRSRWQAKRAWCRANGGLVLLVAVLLVGNRLALPPKDPWGRFLLVALALGLSVAVSARSRRRYA